MRLLLLLSFAAASFAQDKADLRVVQQIRDEAFNRSQVMETLFYLTDANGPRVTNSNGFKAAADWVVKRLEGYGLINVKQEPWGAFGRSWNLTHYEGHMLEPQYSPLIGFPLAWSDATPGVVRGDALLAPLSTEADLAKYKGQLRGKMVLTMAPHELEMAMAPYAHRLTDEELRQRAETPDPSRFAFGPGAPGGRGRGNAPPQDPAAQRRFREHMLQFLIDEKPAVVIMFSPIQDGGTVFGSSLGSYKAGEPLPPPAVQLAEEHYNRIARLLEHKVPVKLEFDIRSKTGTQAEQSFNIVAEIKGTKKPDEIVMLGGHFDSWQGGTGATDNATGSSVAIEAIRILKALNLQMDRTVRLALWSGEEEGLLGSIAYVKNHFADRADMKTKPEYGKLVAYFNDDNGTGKFRGINLGGNDLVRPIFEAWIKPFNDLGATVVAGASGPTDRAPGGTDHTSFTYVGLDGFGFLQDPMEYATRTHHSNMDLYDRVQKGDVMQAAAIEAAFVYHTAVRPDPLPRAPMPKPQPWATR
ncbi:MAG: M20/M25/M40 family metallo-hydrolase [Acidobacteriia bacterium]|nr:M20/M25/M40 family metallo-hydrolase [Terriglobia bacterium]